MVLQQIDGGIVANNPSIVAVSKAMAHYPFLSSGNIAVLSLGLIICFRILQSCTSNMLSTLTFPSVIGAGSFPRHTNVFSAGKGNLECLFLKRSRFLGHVSLTYIDYYSQFIFKNRQALCWRLTY